MYPFNVQRIVSVQRLPVLSSARKALGFVCFGINSPRLINCNTAQTISSCFIRSDNDSYQTMQWRKPLQRAILTAIKQVYSVQTFTEVVQEFEYRESRVYYSKLKSRSGLVSLAGIEIETQTSRIETHSSRIESRLDCRFPIHARIENLVSTYF